MGADLRFVAVLGAGSVTGAAAPPTPKQVFILDDEDRALVGQRRGEHMRLGFAFPSVTVRWLGTFLEDPLDVPWVVLEFVAEHENVVPLPQIPAGDPRVLLCRTPIASGAPRRARFFGRGAGLAHCAHRLPTPSRAWPMGRPAGH
ncbi:DUF4158 domain-containing protein [Nonomuraea sp. NPDC050451]|uniref:DUF4158 domain-containing protein n=1 Tax=Nonomuraea sp. NPDC050451 TaxID=3364364 RepID=UPI00378B8A38